MKINQSIKSIIFLSCLYSLGVYSKIFEERIDEPSEIDFSIGYIYINQNQFITCNDNKNHFAKSDEIFFRSNYHPVNKNDLSSSNDIIKSNVAVKRENKFIQWSYVLPSNSNFLASQRGNATNLKSAWDIAHEIRKEKINKISRMSLDSTCLPSIVVEPDFTIKKHDKLIKITKSDFKNSSVWPIPNSNKLWHKGDEYTQLTKALDEIKNNKEIIISDKNRIKIAHLDTGYSGDDVSLSDFFQIDKSRDFTNCSYELGEGYESCINNTTGLVPKGSVLPSHGMKILSVLSGNEFINRDGKIQNNMGGNPLAYVREYRISDSVFHLKTIAMTKAIDWAIEKKLDVLSISAGGFPSIKQRDVINKAYNNGVIIVAAAGNHYKLPVIPISSPKTVGFPARYSRVMGVAGITADGKSYADNPCFWCQFNFFKYKKTIIPWMMRGNFGPHEVMKVNFISAYTPNIINSLYKNDDDHKFKAIGQGTSNATPQVAAAISLWLQKERESIEEKGLWNSWEKTEAAYRAVSKSAKMKELTKNKYGAGVLQAHNLLNDKYNFVSLCGGMSNELKCTGLKETDESIIGSKWIFDLFRSLLPSITVSQVNGENDKIDEEFLVMLNMEAQQILINNKQFNKLLDSNNININDKKLVKKLLLKNKYTSDTLRKFLSHE